MVLQPTWSLPSPYGFTPASPSSMLLIRPICATNLYYSALSKMEQVKAFHHYVHEKIHAELQRVRLHILKHNLFLLSHSKDLRRFSEDCHHSFFHHLLFSWAQSSSQCHTVCVSYMYIYVVATPLSVSSLNIWNLSLNHASSMSK